MSASIEYLCYGPAANINIFFLTARWSTLDIRFWRLKLIPMLHRHIAQLSQYFSFTLHIVVYIRYFKYLHFHKRIIILLWGLAEVVFVATGYIYWWCYFLYVGLCIFVLKARAGALVQLSMPWSQFTKGAFMHGSSRTVLTVFYALVTIH